jgi:conjugal transfer mating pair stabilization protein TraG
LTSEQLAEFKQFGDRVSRDSSFASVVASDAREARELSSRLNSSSTRSSRAEAGLSDRSAYAERVSAAYERGEVIALDIAQDPHNLAMFTRYAEQYGGTSAAARALMEAELARQSLGPNRTLSDGTAVPLSFESLRTQHARQASQLAEGPDIESVKRTGDAAVARQPGLPSGAVPSPSAPGTVRDAVSRRGQAIREGVQQQSGALNSAADAGRSEDGTLVAGQSLLKRAAKQVAADAKESAEGAADAVKDLLKRR